MCLDMTLLLLRTLIVVMAVADCKMLVALCWDVSAFIRNGICLTKTIILFSGLPRLKCPAARRRGLLYLHFTPLGETADRISKFSILWGVVCRLVCQKKPGPESDAPR
jgi:hypothetical protein